MGCRHRSKERSPTSPIRCSAIGRGPSASKGLAKEIGKSDTKILRPSGKDLVSYSYIKPPLFCTLLNFAISHP